MENTPENKAKFFAQYWGQKVGRWVKRESLYPVNEGFLSNYDLQYNLLQLKPLSQITDEDAIALMYFLEEKNFVDRLSDKVLWGKSFVEKFERFHLTPQTQVLADHFFRSKGYACPYMGISVEQQIEWGWVKLKSKQPSPMI